MPAALNLMQFSITIMSHKVYWSYISTHTSPCRRRLYGGLCPPNPPHLAASCSPRCSLPVANLRLRWGIPPHPPISIVKCYVVLLELTTKLCIIIVIENRLINNPIYGPVSLLKKCKIGVKNESVPYYDNEAWLETT